MELETINQRICGIDNNGYDFRYRKYTSWHVMDDFVIERSECHRTEHPKQYPTHLHHCELQK